MRVAHDISSGVRCIRIGVNATVMVRDTYIDGNE